jgi:hypothetical protein
LGVASGETEGRGTLVSTDKKQGRLVTIVNGAFAAVVVIVIATTAIVVKPPATPGVAEFAPQAVKPIVDAPKRQSSEFGTSSGGACGGLVCAAGPGEPAAGASPTAPSAQPLPNKEAGAPSALQCYVWPDGSVTQTFDPQSPPCIATWDDAKGNGGATSAGVTATAIRVATPVASNLVEPRPYVEHTRAIVNFINARYQLYGRKLVLVEAPGLQDAPAAQQAAAESVAEQKPFAAMAGDVTRNNLVFRQTLSRHRVITVDGITRRATSADLRANSPYWWDYAPTYDVVQRNAGLFTCRGLAGRPAKWGGVGTQGKPRKFAVVIPESTGNPPDVQPLLQTLSACHVSARVVTVPNNSGDPGASQAFVDLRDDDVTSLFLVTRRTPHFQTTASEVGYYPEWILTGSNDQAAESEWGATSPKEQTTNMFGSVSWNKFLGYQDMPAFKAMLAAGFRGGGSAGTHEIENIYHQLAVLAAGIQMAGPRLTPNTFRDGLHATVFPNPGAGARPYYQASVGFDGKGFQMQRDFTMTWWNTAQPSRYAPGAPGAFCFAERGRRYRPDDQPSGEPKLFTRTDCGWG